MALTKEIIQSTYPLPVYNYKVLIDTETLAFSEVSGLTVHYEKAVYKHGLSFLTGPAIIRAQANDILITLKRGVTAKRSYLYNWLTGKQVKDIFIDLCDEKGNAVIRWKVIKALPLKMDSPSFNADGNNIALESLELIAQNIHIEYL